MEPVQIGLVDRTEGAGVSPEIIQKAAAALNIQVTKHLRKVWDIAPAAVVRHFKPDDAIPFGVWRVELVDELQQHEAGFHSTEHFQPYAKVVAVKGSNDWTIAASHEIIEMLVDPAGNRLQMGRAIELTEGHGITDGHTDVAYVMEICDPCEGHTFAYQIQGVYVSDFVTPAFYACSAVPGAHYSFRHNIAAPRRIRAGGYISWISPETSKMQQMVWLDSNHPPDAKKIEVHDLGAVAGAQNLRSFVDSRTRHKLHPHRGKVRPLHVAATEIKPGAKTRRSGGKDSDHWVTFHQDGVIERKIWEKGAAHPITCMEIVKAHEPVFRPEGTDHTVGNVGCGPVFFEKDLIPPR
jgi:hypothetical protein